jgi:hypothetical protein
MAVTYRAFLAALLLAATAAAVGGCSKPEVTGSGPGTDRAGGGGGIGGPGGSGSTTDGPVVVLPDAGGGAAPAPPPGLGDKCAEDSHQAEQIPVDLLLVVDTSGSMTFLGGNRSKWSRATEGLAGFLKDPRSAGLGVGLQFFPTLAPEKECTTEQECPPAGIFAERCQQRSACGVAGALLPNDALDCDGDLDECPVGQVCLPIGRCSASGARCLGVGQPCPGGMTGDSCQVAPRLCNLPSGSWCTQPFDRPAVPIAALPGSEPALAKALSAVIPRGGTPLGPAVRGALTHLRGHLMTNPGRRGAVVVVSDGLPDGYCSGNNIAQMLPDVQRAATGMPAIPTYVIGVFAEDEVLRARPALEQLATAGATGAPFVLTAMDDLSQRFQEALNQIRGTAVACEFKIPPPTAGGSLDFGKVNVRTQAGGVDQDLLYVGSAGRCDPMRGGWYFDADPATGGVPGRVLLCEASCNGIKAAAGSRVEVRYGCKTRAID